MSATADLTLLSGSVLEIAREVRLMRLQVDNLVARLAAQDGRISAMEQSFHDLIGEVSRGFGQNEQRLTRMESRMDALDAGLTALGESLAENTERIIREFKANGR